MRVAVAAGPGRTALLKELADDGSGQRAGVLLNDLPDAVASYTRSGPVRWVWADTAQTYPALLRAGVRVDRCHDVRLVEALLAGRDGWPGAAGPGAGWAWAAVGSGAAGPGAAEQGAARLAAARLAAARPATGPGRLAAGQQAALFGPAEPGLAEASAALDQLVAVHAEQQAPDRGRPTRRGSPCSPRPSRRRLVAAEMQARGPALARRRA